MFEQMKPEADQIWADASVTIPGILYWASGSAPADTRWSPLDPARSLQRPAPGPLPSWVESDYLAHNVAEFQRTGFHGALNYYRAAELYLICSQHGKARRSRSPRFTYPERQTAWERFIPLPKSCEPAFRVSSGTWNSTT
jgi:hypothetical protein